MWVDNATGSYLRIGSPVFYMPVNNIPVSISLSASSNHNLTAKVYVTSSNSYEFTVKKDSYSDYTVSNLILDKSLSKVQIENSQLTNYYKLYIRTVIIKYRDN